MTRVVTCSSYGNGLHYGLSMFVEFEKFQYASVIRILVRLNMLPHITKLYKNGYAIFQGVTITSPGYQTRYPTRYCTFSLYLTLIDHNATHYHNFNALPQVLLYIFLAV